MKKKIILVCLILACCSSGLFAKSHYRHHHWGEHIYTGEEITTPEKVAKVKKLYVVSDSIYDENTFVVYKYHGPEFIYSGCGHHDYEIRYAEIIRPATSGEISWYRFKKVLVVLGIIVLFIIAFIAEELK